MAIRFLPLVVTLSAFVGRSEGSVVICTYVNPPPTVTLLGDAIDFGNVEVGESAERALVVWNYGLLPVFPSLRSTQAGFSVSSTGEIPPSGSMTVMVTFAPTQPKTYRAGIAVFGPCDQQGSTITVSGAGTVRNYDVSVWNRELADRGRSVSSVEVSGQPSSVNLSTVELSFRMTHPAVEHLEIWLLPPRGPRMVIRKREGHGAGLEISAEHLPSSRTIDPNGTWKLIVEDRLRDGKVGVVESWRLRFPLDGAPK
jgi:hypothetical protein